MNTIKEQATINVTAKDAKSYEIGFEAGANYVISCIEKEMLSCKAFSQSQLRLIMQFCEKLEATNK